MMNRKFNQELVNSLMKLIKAYDITTEYIDNYRQYQDAISKNNNLDKEFIRIMNENGYDVQVSMCAELATYKLRSSRFSSAEEAVQWYINDLTKEDDSMNNQNKNNITTNNSTTKEENNMMNDTNVIATNNSTTVAKEVNMRVMNKEMLEVLDKLPRPMQLVQVLEWIDNINNIHDFYYVKKDVLADFLFNKDIIGHQLSNNELKKTKRDKLVDILRNTVQNITKAGVIKPIKVVETINVEVPVSDAKTKTIETLKLIKAASIDNHNRGFGTTVSAYMLCAYILQAGYGIKKLKGHEAEITDEQKDTVKRVRQWLIDKGYIKACVYKTNGKSVYTDDYDGNHAASMVHHSKSLGLTCVGVSSYKICF